jgi:hypothetical protein
MLGISWRGFTSGDYGKEAMVHVESANIPTNVYFN